MMNSPIPISQVLERLLQLSEQERALPFVLSVEVPGANAREPSQVLFVPLTHIEQLTEALHDTSAGLCPASALPVSEETAPVVYPAGQLLFTYILPDYGQPACLPDTELPAPPICP
jgi:hypothetical protein